MQSKGPKTQKSVPFLDESTASRVTTSTGQYFFLLRVGGLTHFLGGQIQIFKYPNNAHTRAHACSIKNFQNFGGYNATASLV